MSTNSPSKTPVWIGRALSTLVIIMLIGSGGAKISHQAAMVPDFVEKFGYPETLLTPIGIIEVLCVLLYAIPRTSVLGAILLTGYMGGAVATHVRIGDMFVPPLMIGVFVWLGLFLRDAGIRALLPWRK
jgi:hypothetical protein